MATGASTSRSATSRAEATNWPRKSCESFANTPLPLGGQHSEPTGSGLHSSGSTRAARAHRKQGRKEGRKLTEWSQLLLVAVCCCCFIRCTFLTFGLFVCSTDCFLACYSCCCCFACCCSSCSSRSSYLSATRARTNTQTRDKSHCAPGGQAGSARREQLRARPHPTLGGASLQYKRTHSNPIDTYGLSEAAPLVSPLVCSLLPWNGPRGAAREWNKEEGGGGGLGRARVAPPNSGQRN